MKRRSYAALVAAGLVPVTGCLQSNDADGVPTSTETQSRVVARETASVGNLDVQVSEPQLAKSVFLDQELFISIEGPEDVQFVVASVIVRSDTGIDDLEFTLVVDDEIQESEFDPTMVVGNDLIALPTPIAEADRAHIAVTYRDDRVMWELDSGFFRSSMTFPRFQFSTRQSRRTTECSRWR